MVSSDSRASATRLPSTPSSAARAGFERTLSSAVASPRASPSGPSSPVRPGSTSYPLPPPSAAAPRQRALRRGQQLRNVLAVAEELHRAVEAELRGQRLGLGAQRPLADEVQLRLRNGLPHRGQGSQGRAGPLGPREPSDHENPAAHGLTWKRIALQEHAVRNHAVLPRPADPLGEPSGSAGRGST